MNCPSDATRRRLNRLSKLVVLVIRIWNKRYVSQAYTSFVDMTFRQSTRANWIRSCMTKSQRWWSETPSSMNDPQLTSVSVSQLLDLFSTSFVWIMIPPIIKDWRVPLLSARIPTRSELCFFVQLLPGEQCICTMNSLLSTLRPDVAQIQVNGDSVYGSLESDYRTVIWTSSFIRFKRSLRHGRQRGRP